MMYPFLYRTKAGLAAFNITVYNYSDPVPGQLDCKMYATHQ